MRKFVCAAIVAVFAVSIAMADEFNATITKTEDGKVTFIKKGKKGDPKPEAMTLPTTKDLKAVKGTFDPDTKKYVAGDKIEGGLKGSVFAKIGDKGVNARITTDADNKNITQILVISPKKKKDAN